MKRLRLLVSLPNRNHYQEEQAKVATTQASHLGAEVEVLDADNNPVTQSQQLVDAIQCQSKRPDAVLVEPLTKMALERVAEAAVSAGIGWVALNCHPEYLDRLRNQAKAPVFAVTRDHVEIGRTQARQFAALLPDGGTVLYIQGPSMNEAALQRTQGMESVKPANIVIRALRSQWTEGSAYEAVQAWLKLSTSRPSTIHAVGCQYDGIARGARRAFAEVASTEERASWLKLPLTGVDGLPDEGQIWVNRREMTATVVSLTTTGVAVEKAVRALESGAQPDAVTMVAVESYPALEQLAAKQKPEHAAWRSAHR